MKINNLLHISRLDKNYNEDKKYEEEIFFGPWCISSREYLESTCDLFIDYDAVLIEENIHFGLLEADKLVDNCIKYLGNYLNKYHGVGYSKLFWRTILVNWLTHIIHSIHFYYNQLLKLNEQISSKYVVITDSRINYNRLSDPMTNDSQEMNEYIHGLISLIVEEADFSKIKFEKKSIITPVVKKETTSKSFLSKIFWFVLKNKTSRYLSYNNFTLSNIEKLLMKFKYKDFSFSYKEVIECKKEMVVLDFYLGDSVIERIISKFINRFSPASLTHCFKRYLFNSKDYIGRHSIVGSYGVYQDEQLFEIALARENGSKFILMEEGANGAPKYNAEENYSYKISDFYLSFGWTKVGYEDRIISAASPRLSRFYNRHEEKNDKILYLSGIRMNFSMYSSYLTHSSKYVKNKVSFIFEIINAGFNDKMIVKPHQTVQYTSLNNDDEIKDIFNLPYTHSFERQVWLSNCAIFYVDYLSTSIFEGFMYNVPTIICLDKDLVIVDDELIKHFEIFKKLGIFFDNPVAAAQRILSIYDNRVSFWNRKNIQVARQNFLNDWAKHHDNWLDTIINIIRRLDD